jgi:hypothetical protein
LNLEYFHKHLANTQFHIGMGEGLGYVFSSLRSELQNKILLKSSEKSQLARGVGNGIGHLFYYLMDHEELQNTIFREMDINKIGDFDDNIKHLNKQQEQRIIDICKHVNEKYGKRCGRHVIGIVIIRIVHYTISILISKQRIINEIKN